MATNLSEPKRPIGKRGSSRSYDPGERRRIRHVGPGLFDVESFKTDDRWYRVDLNRAGATCTCAAFRKNGVAADEKHIAYAIDETRRSVREKAVAMNLDVQYLRDRALFGDDRPEIRAGIEDAIEILEGREPKPVPTVPTVPTVIGNVVELPIDPAPAVTVDNSVIWSDWFREHRRFRRDLSAAA